MVTIDENFVPPMAIHPWEIVLDELEALGLKQKDLAERLGMKAPNLNALIKQNKPITPSIANRLEEVLTIPADSWLSLQARYERNVKEISLRDEREKKAIVEEQLLSEVLNLKALLKAIGKASFRAQERIQTLIDFFGVGDITDLISRCQVQGLYKKSDKSSTNQKNMNTWLLLADRASRLAEVTNIYTHGNALKAGEAMVALTHSGEVTEDKIREILTQNGIGYQHIEKLDQVPVDGYSRISDGKPCIVVTHRYNDLHKLVFVVLHELGHIHLHLSEHTDTAFVSALDDNSQSELEEEANQFAQELLIPKDVWKKLMSVGSSNMYPKTITQTLKAQAEKYGISFPIALQRYQYETGNYRINRPKACPIR